MSSAIRLRTERVSIRSSRGARLLYASDLHLGWPWTRRVADQVVEHVREIRPDALLLGGDLCDSTRSLTQLTRLVRHASEHAPVLAVPGNHDLHLGVDRVRAAVVEAGGRWLVEGSHAVAGLAIEGRARRLAPAASSSAVRVLCAHRPAIVDAAARSGFDLVLAGHVHGGQIVLFERGGRLYPYAWFERWNGPRFEVGSTTMLVSRGAGDALPIRYRCPREVVLCELEPAHRDRDVVGAR